MSKVDFRSLEKLAAGGFSIGSPSQIAGMAAGALLAAPAAYMLTPSQDKRKKAAAAIAAALLAGEGGRRLGGVYDERAAMEKDKAKLDAANEPLIEAGVRQKVEQLDELIKNMKTNDASAEMIAKAEKARGNLVSDAAAGNIVPAYGKLPAGGKLPAPVKRYTKNV